MDDLDRQIEEALSAEDRAILEKFGEQGVSRPVVRRLFRRHAAALRLWRRSSQFALFLGAVYCGWKFFGASEAIDAARWGVGAVMLMVMVGYPEVVVLASNGIESRLA